MDGKLSRRLMTRRTALAGLAGSAWGFVLPGSDGGAAADEGDGPVLSQDGPNADLYGASEGYPVPDARLVAREGNPYPPKFRVGAFSHIDELYPTRRIVRAAVPWPFKREVWLPVLASPQRQTPIRAGRFQGPAHLHRPLLKADPGPDWAGRRRRGLAALVRRGSAIRLETCLFNNRSYRLDSSRRAWDRR
jgi:hypothetical protein